MGAFTPLPESLTKRSSSKPMHVLGASAFLLFFVAAGLLTVVMMRKNTTSTNAVQPTPTQTSINVYITPAEATPTPEDYSNPFDETTQYENPFEDSENPFDQLQP